MPTVKDLKEEARRRGYSGYSKLNKTELIALLESHQATHVPCEEIKRMARRCDTSGLTKTRTTLPPVTNLAKLTVPQLRAKAKSRGYTGYSKLRKAQLITLLHKGRIPATRATRSTGTKTVTKRVESNVKFRELSAMLKPYFPGLVILNEIHPDVYRVLWKNKPAVLKGVFAPDEILDKPVTAAQYCRRLKSILKDVQRSGLGPDFYGISTIGHKHGSDMCYIITEYLPTVFTADVVAAMSKAEKRDLSDKIFNVARSAHMLGFYHGDVRARNTGLKSNGQMVFIDWDSAIPMQTLIDNEDNLIFDGKRITLQQLLQSDLRREAYGIS